MGALAELLEYQCNYQWYAFEKYAPSSLFGSSSASSPNSKSREAGGICMGKTGSKSLYPSTMSSRSSCRSPDGSRQSRLGPWLIPRRQKESRKTMVSIRGRSSNASCAVRISACISAFGGRAIVAQLHRQALHAMPLDVVPYLYLCSLPCDG